MSLVTEWKSPSAWGLVYADWSFPDRVVTSNNLYAAAQAADPIYQRTHGFAGLGFLVSKIPAASLVRGFEFKHEAKRGGVVDTIESKFRLLKAGVPYGDWTSSLWWTLTSDRTQYVGGDGFLFGGAWLDTDIVGVSLFGFICAVDFTADLSTLYTDLLQMRVWYDLAPVVTEEPHRVSAPQRFETTVQGAQNLDTAITASQEIPVEIRSEQTLDVSVSAPQIITPTLEAQQET